MLTPDQCRAARALLNWSQGTLAEVAGVARATIAAFEAGKRSPIGNNLASIKGAFEDQGVDFIQDDNVVGVTIPKVLIEAGIVQGNEQAVVFVEGGLGPVALSLRDAAAEADRAENEFDKKRAKAIRRAIDEAKTLKG